MSNAAHCVRVVPYRHCRMTGDGGQAPPATPVDSSNTHSRSRDLVLDAWRGLSVLIVICDHSIECQVDWSRLIGRASPPTGHISWPMLHFAENFGGYGVQFFYLISGYLITSLLLREQQRNGSVSLSAFYVRRAFRILPPMWLVLGFTAALGALAFIVLPTGSLAYAAAFTCNMWIERCGWFAGHLWSLAVEEQFYFVWPALLVLLRFRGVALAATTLAIFWLVIVQMVTYPEVAMGFACIALGCLYAASGRLRSMIERAASWPMIALAVALLLGMAMAPIVVRGQYRLQHLLHPLLICFLLFSSFRYRPLLEKLLIARVLAGLGLWSYSLYLWQQMFVAKATLYLRPSFLEFAPLLVAFALLSYYLLEKPMMRIGALLSRRLIDRRLRNGGHQPDGAVAPSAEVA